MATNVQHQQQPASTPIEIPQPARKRKRTNTPSTTTQEPVSQSTPAKKSVKKPTAPKPPPEEKEKTPRQLSVMWMQLIEPTATWATKWNTFKSTYPDIYAQLAALYSAGTFKSNRKTNKCLRCLYKYIVLGDATKEQDVINSVAEKPKKATLGPTAVAAKSTEEGHQDKMAIDKEDEDEEHEGDEDSENDE